MTTHNAFPQPTSGQNGDYLPAGGIVGAPLQPFPVDFDRAPVRISPSPLPRSRNPGYRHLRAQESSVSAVSKRSQLNKLALLLGAPNPRRLGVDGDARQLHPNQLFPYDFVHWEDLSSEVVDELLAHLRDLELAGATRNSYRALLRGVAKEAWKLRLMDHETFELIKSVSAIRYRKLPGGKAHPERVIRALLDVCDAKDDARSRRDGLMIALMATTGPRRAEVSGIQLSDINFVTREIKITGKGNKDRMIQVPGAVWDRLIDYVKNYRGDKPGALFTPVWNKRKAPDVVVKGLSTASINSRIDVIRKQAEGLTGISIAPHDLRRTFATDLFNAGMALRELQILLGHASMATTETYVFDESSEYRAKAANLNADRFRAKTAEDK
ncbi:site-specific integrase [Halomonas sp. McH1-25]|uniref:tyrosine-type recombinase/integrase n=1 Tax=unclassified Halomonas TaxID=2609666 RepID=UPI001EF48E13|nr:MULTISPECIES: site-specific integrase [unclassified Halomonas]MCG7602132.1 site-specific integrase [Halomonas sp. McH1-25]MCP1344411.1 site-specific integrase [Halomonas sp. FL8]MCP1362499.1 site-specific integrase [Halomonas sp. BBD45]MCP1364556.1 site-specific integrase [Halomonas sp. BBD48]